MWYTVPVAVNNRSRKQPRSARRNVRRGMTEGGFLIFMGLIILLVVIVAVIAVVSSVSGTAAAIADEEDNEE